jgi:hypothetical protein
MLKHFESSVGVGTPGADIRLLAKARQNEQLAQIDVVAKLLALPVSAPTGSTDCPPNHQQDEYCISLTFRLDNADPMNMGFNSNKPDWVNAKPELLEYKTENNAPMYLVSNGNGNFEKPPQDQQLILSADTAYLLSGTIAQQGNSKPVVWLFQYVGGKREDSQSVPVTNGRFRLAFRTLPHVEALAIGIRLAGEGSIDLKKTVFTLKEQNNEELIAFFEEKSANWKIPAETVSKTPCASWRPVSGYSIIWATKPFCLICINGQSVQTSASC